ncbi:hypothetical protein LTR95_014663 [Oleoguttula sp. CCFEE 5521]
MPSPPAPTPLARRCSSVYSREVDGTAIDRPQTIVDPPTSTSPPGPRPSHPGPMLVDPPPPNAIVEPKDPTPDRAEDTCSPIPVQDPHPGTRVPTPDDPAPPSPVARAGNPTPDRASGGRREPFPPFAYESYPEFVLLPLSPELERRSRVERLKGWLRRVLKRDFRGPERDPRTTERRTRSRGRGRRVGEEEGYVPISRWDLERRGLEIRGLGRKGVG